MSKRKHRGPASGPGRRGAPGAGTRRPAERTASRPLRRSTPVRSGSGAARPAAASGRERPYWLFGVHPVLAAAANPRRRLRRVLLTAEAQISVGPRLLTLLDGRDDSPEPEIVPREVLDRTLARGAVHQGVAVEVEGLEPFAIEDLCRLLDGQDRGRVVILDQVTDPHNVGAVLRSAAAFGAAAVVVPERNAPGATGVMAKAAAGALERVPLVSVVNLARAIGALKKSGLWCVGFDGGATTPLHEADLSGKVALVLGAEGEGLRRLTREHCDLMVRIPMEQGTDSLNVSNAAAIALYELARRG